MSESAPVRPAPSTTDLPYRPVSVMAIAGVVVSGLFAAWVAITGIVAFRSQTPFLMDPVSLVLPLVGFGLSVAARIQIRRSEGTRAGALLTTWGLGLSLLFGLGYAAYRGATELALRQQAQQFTVAWFDMLRGDDVDRHIAFWDTVEPARRQRLDLDKPEARLLLKSNPAAFAEAKAVMRNTFLWGEARGGVQPGALPHFFSHDLVELIHQAGEQVQIEPRGIRSWEHVGGSMPGYKVEQDYRITTPDGDYEVLVALLGTDDRETGQRHWWVVMNETGVRGHKLSPRGQAAVQLRANGQLFAANWTKALAAGQLEDAYLGTVPPPQRDAALSTYLGQTILMLVGTPQSGTGPYLTACAMLANPVPAQALFQPGFAAFQGRLVRSSGLVTPDASDRKSRDQVVREVDRLFRSSERDGRVSMQVGDPGRRSSCRYEIDKGVVRFVLPFELHLGNELRCDGTIVVATSSASVQAALGAGGKDPEGPSALRLGGTNANVRWWITGLDLEMAVGGPKPVRP